jgi:thioredoxin reductase (NADPH)
VRSAGGLIVSKPAIPAVGDDPAVAVAIALETSVPSVFAAGDVRLDSTPVASAVGEGAMPVYLVHRYPATV